MLKAVLLFYNTSHENRQKSFPHFFLTALLPSGVMHSDCLQQGAGKCLERLQLIRNENLGLMTARVGNVTLEMTYLWKALQVN